MADSLTHMPESTTHPETSRPSSSLPVYLLLWGLGFYLRLGVLVVPPLIPQLKGELGFTNSELAIATSLPLLCLAGGALLAGGLLSRLGTLKTLGWGLAIMALGSALRVWPEDIIGFLAMTTLMGIGLALLQTGVPVLAKQWLPAHIGRASAVYTNGLLAGELLAAGLTGPLAAHWLGAQWQWAFALWMLPVPLLLLALLRWRASATSIPGPVVSPSPSRAWPEWRDPLLWRLSILLACAGGLYFCGNVFLPPILEAHGRLDLLNASLAALNGAQLVSSGLLVVWADRLVGRRWPVAVLIVVAVALIPALLWPVGWGVVVAAATFGFMTSSLLVFAMALPPWLVSAERVPRMMSGVLCLGYGGVFLIPVVGGWLRDVGGGLGMAFLPGVVISLLALIGLRGCRRDAAA
ncbi:MFS transporter [Halomonas sp. WWR20]